MLLYLLGWMSTGFVTVFIATIIHVIKAIKKGYDMDIISKACYGMVSGADFKIVRCIWGLLIWPIRLVQMIVDLPSYYDAYEQVKKGLN